MKKWIIITGFVMLFGLMGCQQKSESNALTVLTSSGYEPYEMVDNNGQLTGFDIELMEALAQEAGLTITWKDVNFDGIIASLQSGQYEVAIAGISPTADRAEIVDFSQVYYNSEDGIVNDLVYPSDQSYASFQDLSGLVIGAQLGTIQADLLNELSDTYGFTVELRNTNAQVMEEIRIHNIDALLVENLVADSILEVNTDFSKTIMDTPLDQLYGNAIAFTKGSAYVDVFNTALETLKANGTLTQLIEKWF